MTAEEQLKSELAEVERLRKIVAIKDAEITRKDAEIKKLSDTLLWLRRKVYGKMSEKHPGGLRISEIQDIKYKTDRNLLM